MDCKFAVKVSMLVDGELGAEDSEQARAHLSGCAGCRALERDFLLLRGEIKQSSAGAAKRFEVPALTAPKQIPYWRRGIYVPLPVSLLFLLAFLGLSVWLAASRRNRGFTASAPPGHLKPPPVRPENEGPDFSLARYDAGGRAEIYVTRRRSE